MPENCLWCNPTNAMFSVMFTVFSVLILISLSTSFHSGFILAHAKKKNAVCSFCHLTGMPCICQNLRFPSCWVGYMWGIYCVISSIVALLVLFLWLTGNGLPVCTTYVHVKFVFFQKLVSLSLAVLPRLKVFGTLLPLRTEVLFFIFFYCKLLYVWIHGLHDIQYVVSLVLLLVLGQFLLRCIQRVYVVLYQLYVLPLRRMLFGSCYLWCHLLWIFLC